MRLWLQKIGFEIFSKHYLELLDEVFSFAIQTLNLEKLQLGTYESLGRAINFYLKNGFVEKEELRDSTTHARYYEMILN